MMIYLASFLFVMSALFIAICGVWSLYLLLTSGCCRISPAVPTTGRIKKALLADMSAHLTAHPQQKVAELGSGWGGLVLPLARKHPTSQFVGIECSLGPYLVARWRGRKYTNLTFLRINFFDMPLDDISMIYLFLLPKEMRRLEEKCRQQMPPGALIYSNRFRFPHLKPLFQYSFGSAYETYYRYQIPATERHTPKPRQKHTVSG